jgi:hypothetical protein
MPRDSASLIADPSSNRDGGPMFDDAFGPVDVTGRWVGFYRQSSEEEGSYPIVAEIRLNSDRIAGEMYDQITDRSRLLDTILERYGQEMTQRNKRRLEASVNQFGAGNIIVNSRLPDTSDIAGRISGNQVSFTKTYRGVYSTLWTVGGRQVGYGHRRRHRVYYSGHVDPEQMCIAGEWIIRQRSLFGRFLPPDARGRFELYRKA